MRTGSGRSEAWLIDALAFEHAGLGRLLRSLDSAQWAAPTACSGWTVIDIARHIVAWDELLASRSIARYAVAVGRAGGSTNGLDRRLLARERDASPADLVERIDHLEQTGARLFDRLAPGAQLAEVIVHHEDIRQAVGQHLRTDVTDVDRALDGILRLPGVGAKRRRRGVRLLASDSGWSVGAGPEVRGPGLALLVALAVAATPSRCSTARASTPS